VHPARARAHLPSASTRRIQLFEVPFASAMNDRDLALLALLARMLDLSTRLTL
jgi:hypothetical protein